MEIDVRPFDGDATRLLRGRRAGLRRAAARRGLRAAGSASSRPDRAIAAYDGDRIVGTAGIFSFDLTVPGGVLPAAGVTIVGVHPTHRRRGILRRMMRLQLDAIHDRGEPLAILWASEGEHLPALRLRARDARRTGSIARARPAAPSARRTCRPARSDSSTSTRRSASSRRSTTRFVRTAPDSSTALRRTGTRDVFHDPEHWRRGASAAFHVVHEVAGEPDGYARYRIRDEWDDGGPEVDGSWSPS